MPISIATLRCRLDPDLDAALFAYQERLGDQLIAARAQLAAIRSLGATVTSQFSGPLRHNLDVVLASAGTSTEALTDATSLVLGDTTADVESAVDDRFSLTVVGGRVIPPGSTDLSSIATLARLLGGFEAIFSVLPELLDTVGSDTDPSLHPTVFASTFTLVITYIKRNVTPATACTPEVVVETEVTLGVDSPVSEVLSSSGVPLESLRYYVFWIGRPLAAPEARAKARRLGLSSSQFVDAVSNTSRFNFFVKVVSDPADVARVSTSFGSSAYEILNRIRGPVSLFPSPSQLSDLLLNTIRSSSPGSAGPSGLPDFSSPALSVLTVLDIKKTFNLADLVASLALAGSDPSAAAFAEGMGNAILSQLEVISTIIKEAQSVVTSVLNEVVALTSVVNMLLNDLSTGLMDCLLGSSFSVSSFGSLGLSGSLGIGLGGPGSPGVPGASTSNPLDNILSTIEGQSSLLNDFFSSVGTLLGSVSDISCSASFTAAAPGVSSSFGPIPCQTSAASSAGFELPAVTQNVLDTTRTVMDLLTRLFDSVRTNLRGLRMTTNSLSLSLRVNLERRASSFSASSLPSPPSSPGCASPEAARLASLLVARSLEAFTPPSV